MSPLSVAFCMAAVCAKVNWGWALPRSAQCRTAICVQAVTGLGPLPDVSCHIVQTKCTASRRVVTNGGSRHRAICFSVADLRRNNLFVLLSLAARSTCVRMRRSRRLFAPRIASAVWSSRRRLPFIFRRQALSLPFAVCLGLFKGKTIDGMLLTTAHGPIAVAAGTGVHRRGALTFLETDLVGRHCHLGQIDLKGRQSDRVQWVLRDSILRPEFVVSARNACRRWLRCFRRRWRLERLRRFFCF